MNARCYGSSNGRFISQDSYRGSIDEPSQWHLYVYCANNPINYVDPSGHWSLEQYKPISFKQKWIKRGAVAEIIDVAITLFSPTVKTSFTIIDDAIKDAIVKKLKRLSDKDLKKIIKNYSQKVVNKLSPRSQQIYDLILSGAKRIRPKSIMNDVVSFLEKTKFKNAVKYKIKSFISNSVTNWISQILKYDQYDCISSVSGFSAGIIEYGIDGNLKDGKIYWG